MQPALILAALVIGYALGAIPSGAIVARLYGHVDLTAHGSGKTGATNVLRTLGPGAAAFAFGGDFLKGVLAVLAAMQLSRDDAWLQLAAATGAVIGHSYSPFIGFKGGRGVVTGLAATVVAAPVLMLVAAVVGGALIAASRYVSLGSVGGATVGGLLMVWMGLSTGQPAYALWGVLVGGFIVVAHRDNIQRLLAGTERRLGQRANVT